MKIMQVITLAGVGGAQNVVRELIQHLTAEGHDVILVAHYKGALWESLENLDIKCYPLPSFIRSICPLFDLRTFFKLRQIYAQEKPDIIHLHSAKAGFLGRLAFFFERKKVIFTQHGFDTILTGHPKTLPIEKLADRWCYCQVAVSKYDLTLLESVHIYGGMKGTRVIYNGISPLPQRESLPLLPTFKRLKSEGKKVLLSLARFDTTQDKKGNYLDGQAKDFPLTVAVARELGGDYHILWMGNTGKPPADLPSNMTLLGLVPDAKSYLPHADMFLLLSHYEGLPMSILESFASRTPVFASNVGGISEAIEDGVSGFLAECEYPLALATKIKGAFESPPALKSIIKVAYQNWESKYTAQIMWEHYLALYIEIVETKKTF